MSGAVRYVVRPANSLTPETILLVQRLWDELGRLYPEMNATLPYFSDSLALLRSHR